MGDSLRNCISRYAAPIYLFSFLNISFFKYRIINLNTKKIAKRIKNVSIFG